MMIKKEYIRKDDALRLVYFYRDKADDEIAKLTGIDIVRCKDCKFAHMTVNEECKYCDIWFPDEKTYVSGDYFCASGERK